MGSKQTVFKLADGIKADCVETGRWDQSGLYSNWQMGSKQTVLKLVDGIKADCVETGGWDQSRLC